MRKERLLVPESYPVGYYHVMSRVVDRQPVLDELGRDRFVSIMRECEEFCEVRVITFCIMANHFHLLLEVLRPPEALPTIEEMFQRLEKLTVQQDVGALRQRVELYRQNQDSQAEEALLKALHGRMYNLSVFMKMLKQRFSKWHNKRTERKGTLWEERFRSVVVDGTGQGLAAMAAYIDLNPVRARMVTDPKDYRWSGYGEAVAGQQKSHGAIASLMATVRGGPEEVEGRGLELYRMFLYNEGREDREIVGEDGRTARGALTQEEVLEVLNGKGKLGLTDYIRCRVRYFSDGAVLGSREFVERIFEAHRERFGGRSTGARRLKGLKEELFVLRDLRRRVFG